jgi:hypothetical protein
MELSRSLTMMLLSGSVGVDSRTDCTFDEMMGETRLRVVADR